ERRAAGGCAWRDLDRLRAPRARDVDVAGDDHVLDVAVAPRTLYDDLRGALVYRERGAAGDSARAFRKRVADGVGQIRSAHGSGELKRCCERRRSRNDLYRECVRGSFHQGFPSSAVNTTLLVEPRAPIPL